MSFLTSWQNFISETEADVEIVIVAIKNDVAVIESDLAAAQRWIVSNEPTIAADIQQVLGIVEAVGLGANPEVAASVALANTAVTALNAFVSASNSGSTATQSVLAGYVAVKQAQSAVAAAKAAAAATPTPAAPAATAAVGLLSAVPSSA